MRGGTRNDTHRAEDEGTHHRWAGLAARTGRTFADRDPATGEVLATIVAAGPEDVDRAATVAAEAFQSRLAPDEACRRRSHPAQDRRRDPHGRREHRAAQCLDTGKPLRQAKNDTEIAARYSEFYGGAADKILGTTIPLGTGFLDYTIREPLGVSAHIVPWNHALQIMGRGVAAALAARNAVALKPASQAPLTALAIGRIALDCVPPRAVDARRPSARASPQPPQRFSGRCIRRPPRRPIR